MSIFYLLIFISLSFEKHRCPYSWLFFLDLSLRFHNALQIGFSAVLTSQAFPRPFSPSLPPVFLLPLSPFSSFNSSPPLRHRSPIFSVFLSFPSLCSTQSPIPSLSLSFPPLPVTHLPSPPLDFSPHTSSLLSLLPHSFPYSCPSPMSTIPLCNSHPRFPPSHTFTPSPSYFSVTHSPFPSSLALPHSSPVSISSSLPCDPLSHPFLVSSSHALLLKSPIPSPFLSPILSHPILHLHHPSQ